jgi:hypothetical protein
MLVAGCPQGSLLFGLSGSAVQNEEKNGQNGRKHDIVNTITFL